MADASKLCLAELSRRSLVRGAACPDGGAIIGLFTSRPDAAPLRQDVIAYQTSPKDEPAAAAKSS